MYTMVEVTVTLTGPLVVILHFTLAGENARLALLLVIEPYMTKPGSGIPGIAWETPTSGNQDMLASVTMDMARTDLFDAFIFMLC
jgi:hypothetical protein